MDKKHIEEHLGDLKKIDISFINGNENAVYLILATVGYIDGTPNMQTALLDKMQGYLSHTQSDWFAKEYPNMNKKLIVTFTEKPHELILKLLDKCISWCDEFNVELLFELEGKRFHITESK